MIIVVMYDIVLLGSVLIKMYLLKKNEISMIDTLEGICWNMCSWI